MDEKRTRVADGRARGNLLTGRERVAIRILKRANFATLEQDGQIQILRLRLGDQICVCEPDKSSPAHRLREEGFQPNAFC